MFEEIISFIDYKTWSIRYEDVGDCYAIWPYFRRQDIDTGEWGYCQNMRKWLIEKWRSEAYIVQTAFAMIKMAEEHEARENFQYKGKSIYSPHKIESLLNV